MSTPKPAAGQVWRHHSGVLYTIITITNEYESEDIDSLTAKASGTEEKYPVTVVYQGDDGRIWSKSPARFLASMTYYREESKMHFLGRVYTALRSRITQTDSHSTLHSLWQSALDAIAATHMQAKQDEQDAAP